VIGVDPQERSQGEDERDDGGQSYFSNTTGRVMCPHGLVSLAR